MESGRALPRGWAFGTAALSLVLTVTVAAVLIVAGRLAGPDLSAGPHAGAEAMLLGLLGTAGGTWYATGRGGPHRPSAGHHNDGEEAQ